MRDTSSQLSSAFSAGTQANPEKHFSQRVIVDTRETLSKFKQNIKTAQSHMGEEKSIGRGPEPAEVPGKFGLLGAGDRSGRPPEVHSKLHYSGLH